MSYAEESRIAQDVLNQIASAGPTFMRPGHGRPDVQGARVDVDGAPYTVHRHGNDLRFNEQGARGVGRYLIVQIGRHLGGWLVAVSKRPPGEYHDGKAAERARFIVERQLASLGHDVGTTGMAGVKKSAAVLEREIEESLRDQPAGVRPIQAKPRRARKAR